MKYDLIALDEVGYVPLADVGAEFLFQVISDRAGENMSRRLHFAFQSVCGIRV
jgi:DNA replication protein DnaC